jgi:ribonucleoside-diphosphate reductase alpha chain
MSTIITDFLNTYKYGWKTSYYQNTYDFKSEDMTDLENDSLATKEQAVIINKQEIDKLSDQDGADCDACAI